MKIVDNRITGLIPFINVTPGDVFEYEDRVYIKVNSDRSIGTFDYLGIDVNSGHIVEFNETDPVNVLTVELNIFPG